MEAARPRPCSRAAPRPPEARGGGCAPEPGCAHLQPMRFHLPRVLSVVRVLGSLLSAHRIITDSKQPFGDMTIQDYDNELLHMAHDLAVRLLPAFENTRTGIPYPRVGRPASRSPASGCGGRTGAEGRWGGGGSRVPECDLSGF